MAKQLIAVLEKYSILDQFQSGFCRAHSTETALPRVYNDILMWSDAGECSVLLMLDLTLTFDTVHHHIVYDRIKYEFPHIYLENILLGPLLNSGPLPHPLTMVCHKGLFWDLYCFFYV